MLTRPTETLQNHLILLHTFTFSPTSSVKLVSEVQSCVMTEIGKYTPGLCLGLCRDSAFVQVLLFRLSLFVSFLLGFVVCLRDLSVFPSCWGFTASFYKLPWRIQQAWKKTDLLHGTHPLPSLFHLRCTTAMDLSIISNLYTYLSHWGTLTTTVFRPNLHHAELNWPPVNNVKVHLVLANLRQCAPCPVGTAVWLTVQVSVIKAELKANCLTLSSRRSVCDEVCVTTNSHLIM